MSESIYDLAIVGGRVVDPALGFGKDLNVYIKDGVIAGMDDNQAVVEKMAPGQVIDAAGMLVVPGLIDIHVHLREPGRERAETVYSGCRAAAAGGFTSVCCMPNTDPVIDNQETVRFVQDRAQEADARVYVVGAITQGLKGEALSEIGDLVKMGAVAVTDDGHYVQNPDIMHRALDYARMFDIPVMQHAEDQYLCAGAVMNESYQSARLGMTGAPGVSEEIAVMRDIALCRHAGGRLHIQHVTTAGAVRAIRQAKAEGVQVTAEATPHHLILTDDEIGKRFDTNLRVNPPLRSKADRDAVLEGLVDGTIDCIASDHAPHTDEDKDCEFDMAPPGMIGLETVVGLIKTYLIDKGYLSWADAIRKMTINPAGILGLPGGKLSEGSPADITVIDPDGKWTVRADGFRSRSRNCPFIGQELSGRPVWTILNGRVVFGGNE
jgi:dihydroorotase